MTTINDAPVINTEPGHDGNVYGLTPSTMLDIAELLKQLNVTVYSITLNQVRTGPVAEIHICTTNVELWNVEELDLPWRPGRRPGWWAAHVGRYLFITSDDRMIPEALR